MGLVTPHGREQSKALRGHPTSQSSIQACFLQRGSRSTVPGPMRAWHTLEGAQNLLGVQGTTPLPWHNYLLPGAIEND